ncbi:MAG TPA: hypothetical protein PK992_18480, partial [Planctomycetaceae bacterium]|nr:hypothetical protein [Planctomycetaceae bacterium]
HNALNQNAPRDTGLGRSHTSLDSGDAAMHRWKLITFADVHWALRRRSSFSPVAGRSQCVLL